MAKWRNLALALLCALTLLTPTLAEARAGGSFGGGRMSYGSQGSLGSRTYNFNGGQSVGRSMTPYANPGASYYGNGFAGNHPFLTGLGGALLGSWLGSLLFPHWGYGWGVGHLFGSLFSWIFIIFAISMLFRFLRRGYGPMTMPPLGGGYGGMGYGGPLPGYGAGNRPVLQSREITVAATDYGAFEAILKAVQGAWSAEDLRSLSHYVTPEMLSYFSEELAGNNSQGVQNHVEQVELLRGDVREAWEEGNMQYATCLLHWRALDYTQRSDRNPGQAGWLVDGDAQHPSEAQELWTFVRSRGGHWLLSAIQQI
ncbi:MAG TPA: TIM44-like domain-containing protein [Stellaceae bacterium]|jgi:hypothetical protein|nr:TIM44-like domain-containing protein [Stellaceae bacterium]